MNKKLSVIENKLIYLSSHYKYVMDSSKPNKWQQKSRGLVYAETYMATIEYIYHFIHDKPTNLQAFHDLLLKLRLQPEVWRYFFKMWSKEYRIQNKIESRIN